MGKKSFSTMPRCFCAQNTIKKYLCRSVGRTFLQTLRSRGIDLRIQNHQAKPSVQAASLAHPTQQSNEARLRHALAIDSNGGGREEFHPKGRGPQRVIHSKRAFI
ncbi:hypothetical protein T439DRAFT_125851 [Meredithblackwellia eburnea MCA 4105]